LKISRWTEEKKAVAETAREMAGLGLVTGSSGNVSLRLAPTEESSELLAVTPSGVPYTALRDEEIVVADFDIEPLESDLMPSSEALLHVAIYRARPDVKAVIHIHSVFASVAAVAGLPIPPIIDEMMIAVGGAVEVSEYAFPSTEDLADSVTIALGERGAALIRNHGVVGVGRDLAEALEVCALVERVAQVFVYASLLGKAEELPAESVEAERAIYRMRHRIME
jgi:L-fuculose-phosphate aldolase